MIPVRNFKIDILFVQINKIWFSDNIIPKSTSEEFRSG